MQAVLGVDIGTSSSKGVLADAQGNILASHEAPHQMSSPQVGWAEHDAEEIWWADFCAISKHLTAKAVELGASIAAICVSGIGPCCLLTDDANKPLRPAILYGVDTRAAKEIDELNRQLGQEEILNRCGSALSSQAVGPKLLWISRHEPEVWKRAKRLYMASSYLVMKLTGRYVLDMHSASQCDPLFDIHCRRWIFSWSSVVCPNLDLPPLHWSTEVIGRTVGGPLNEETGLRENIPVLTGTIDAWAEAASVGICKPGDVMIMYGTTMFFVEVLHQVTPSPIWWTTAGTAPDSYTSAAGMSTSGALTSWFRDLVGSVDYQELIQSASQVQPGSDGLVILPYFAGERTPIFDPNARGVFCGLTLHHGRGHIYRALLEATAYGVRDIVSSMQARSTCERQSFSRRYVAVGGGTKNPLWLQIVSDVTGCIQEVPQRTIGAALGDAWMAACAIGLASPDVPWNQTERRVEPNLKNQRTYDYLFAVYKDLYEATKSQTHALARFQAEGAPEVPEASGSAV